MYKSTHNAHDYLNRVANHSTKGSRRGFIDDEPSFDASMSTSDEQQLAQNKDAIERLVPIMRALEVAWKGREMTRVQRKNAKKKHNQTGRMPWNRNPEAFLEWRRTGSLIRDLTERNLAL